MPGSKRNRQFRSKRGAPYGRHGWARKAGAAAKAVMLAAAARSSRTTTKTRTKNKVPGKPIYSNGDITNSRVNLNYKRMKGWHPIGRFPDVRTIVAGTGLVSTQGQQNASALYNIGTAGQYIEAFDSMLTTTANVAALNTLSSTASDRRLWVDYQSAQSTIVNQGPSLIKVQIFDFVCKISGCEVPEILWYKGLVDAQGTGTVPSNLHYGQDPMESSLLRKNWKVIRKSVIHMASGSTHVHTVKHRVGGVVDLNSAQNTGDRQLKGFSIYTMVIIAGTPVDGAALPGSVGNVTIAPAKIIWTNRTDVKCRLLNYKSRRLDFIDNLSELNPNLYAQNPDGIGIVDVVTNLVNTAIGYS